MSERTLVADTSALIHLMEGKPAAGRLLLGAEIHISVATEIELHAKPATQEACGHRMFRKLLQLHRTAAHPERSLLDVKQSLLHVARTPLNVVRWRVNAMRRQLYLAQWQLNATRRRLHNKPMAVRCHANRAQHGATVVRTGATTTVRQAKEAA